MQVNGENIMLKSIHKDLKSFLMDIGYDPMRVAVEHNGNVIPRASFEHTTLSELDTIEIVCFVGGG